MYKQFTKSNTQKIKNKSFKNGISEVDYEWLWRKTYRTAINKGGWATQHSGKGREKGREEIIIVIVFSTVNCSQFWFPVYGYRQQYSEWCGFHQRWIISAGGSPGLLQHLPYYQRVQSGDQNILQESNFFLACYFQIWFHHHLIVKAFLNTSLITKQ